MIHRQVPQLVIDQYNRLPARAKPRTRPNGVKEWTVLAGVVIKQEGELRLASLATGVKALPDERIKGRGGRVLHDCHAEILALRAFNLFLLEESVIDLTNVEVYLYVCAPPCGDASMSACIDEGSSASYTPSHSLGSVLRGREQHHLLGRIRTKPGRRDSLLTMSKSCTDKLCLRQSRGILLSPLREVFPTKLFLTGLVCPVLPDFERAFSRLEPLKRFKCINSQVPFADYHPNEGKPSQCSVVWTPNTLEIIANGVVQGSNRPSKVSRFALYNRCGNPREIYAKKGPWPDGWLRTAEDIPDST